MSILTDKEKKAIHLMDSNKVIEVLYECIERLGVVSQSEYRDLTKYPYSRENMVQDIQKNKIKHVIICGRRLPYLNDHVTNNK